MMADNFIDDEAEEFLSEIGIELGIFGQFAQAGNLVLLASGVGGGQAA